MAVAKQDSGSKKNTNTTKEQNKQAIQNINRTGTVSGKSSNVKGSSSVVRDTTNTSNLAGNNRQQALGTPKTQRAAGNSTTSSYANALGTPSAKRETGKTFVPETKTPTVSTVTTNLKKNQSILSSMADDSTKKANNVLNGITNAYNSFMENLNSPTKRIQQREEYKWQRTQAKLDAVNKENMELVSQTTDDDYRRMYNADGSRIDYSQQKDDIRNEIAKLDSYIAEIGDEATTEAEISRRKELQERLDAFELLGKKAQALEETYTQQNLKGDYLSSYQEMLSHKNDNIFERFGNVMNHLGNTTANIVPTAFDQMKELGSNAYAKDNIAELNRLHENGEIDDDLYKESLSEWQDYIDRHKSTNSDNLSQIIRANADRINANTYYGANEVERFVLQAGESTAQFLLHYALLGEAATISMSLTSGTDKMNQLLMEGVDPDTAARNGFMTGMVSYITEKIGMDRFVNMMGTPFSADAFGSILLSQLKSGVSEGLEEVVEGLVDPLIDAYTLGVPYEVDGNELKMEFFLGGASGLAMAFGGTAIGTANAAIQVNSLLNERRGVRADVQNQIGQLVVNSQYQKNLLINELNMFKKHYNSMTDTQKQVADELIQKGQNAIDEYNMKSQVQGVTFSADVPYETTSEENNHAIFETYTPDFNSEVQFEQKISETENIINDLMDSQLALESVANETQQILNDNGYNIDAKVFNSLSTEQKQKALVALDFANIMGMNVNVVNDLPQGQHGYVDSKGNITIDASKNPVLFTLSHELTHGTESSKYYSALKDLVMANIGGDWNELVDKKIQDYAKGNIPLDYENAEKEIVARYVEDKLGDEKFIEDLVKYNYSVASRIYQDLKSMGSDDEVVKIRNTFEKAFNDTFEQVKDTIKVSSEEGSAAKYSFDTWTETDKEAVIQDLMKTLDVSEEEARKWVDDVNGVAKIIADNKTILDYDPNPNYSSMKSNDEYVASMDMSTLCKKREMLQGTIDEIQKKLPNYDIDGQEYTKIRQMMKDRGYEVACGFCYVESRRKELGKVAKGFIESRNYDNLTIRDLTTVDGVAELQNTRPEIYEDFVKFNNKRGSGKVNLVQSRTEYRGEIMTKLTKAKIERINRIGGLRLQSYSDFETPHLIDMMQITVDMARRGLTSQAYTKVPNFADAFGKTGIKINESLVCKGVDENGRLIFDDIEGMPHETAFGLREKHPDTVGTVLVGKDDTTILAAMADDRIDYIIPFHRSGWGKAEYAALGIDGYTDYTDFQKEYWVTPKQIQMKNGEFRSENAPSGDEQFYPIDYWDYSKSGKENAETYLRLCAEDGRVPKFSNFLVDNGDGTWSLQPDGSTDGYWKMLIDFKMYDNNGVGVPQEQVQPIFDNDVNQRILNSYEGGHTKNRFASDVVDDFVKSVEDGRRYSYDLEEIKAKHRKSHSLKDALILRDAGEKLSESDFYKVYSAHILNLRGNDNLQEQIDNIKSSGFKGNAGFGINVMPSSINNGINGWTEDSYNQYRNDLLKEYGVESEDGRTPWERLKEDPWRGGTFIDDSFYYPVNMSQMEYGVRKGQTVLLVPNSWVENGQKVKNGFVPFDYEIVTADRNFQPYYELYEKAYDETHPKNIQYSLGEETPLGETEMSDEQMNLKKKVPSSKDIEKEKTAKVMEKAPNKDNTLKDLSKGAFTEAKNKLVSKYAAIEEIAEKSKNKNIKPLLDEVMRSAGRAERSIYEGLYDKSGTKKIGKSLTEIMGDIPQQDRQSFGEYIYHWRNIDEMTMEERHAEELKDARKELSTLEEKRKAVPKKQKKEYTEQIKELRKKISKLESYKNRPVFGENVTAEDSQDRIAEIEQAHPEFKKKAEDLWKLNQQYLKMRQDSGIISEDTYNQFIADRPHYTPIIRDIGPGYVSGANPNDIKKFKGSNRDIYPVEEAMRRHILKSWEVTSQNDLNNELMKELGGGENIDSEDALDLIEEGYVPTESNSSGNQMYAYKNGQKMSIPVSEELYESLVPARTKNSNLKELADKTLAKGSKFRKTVLTSGNPLFSLITNPLRDIQDAFGQSQYRGKFGENYAKFLKKAASEVLNDGDVSKQYDNMGIGQGQYIGKDMYEAIEKMEADKGLKKAWGNLMELGEKIEKIPRLAEFMASLDAGNTPQQAAYDAAEITTNFKRGGTWVKNLDKYGFPFLNASVQGFDKQIRNAKGDIETVRNNGIKGFITVLARLTLAAGIPLRMLQDWIWKDDDDYKELSDYIKSRYYIIPNLFAKDKKFGNRFVRIPKGRVAAFYQTVLTGAYDLVKKQTDVWNMLLDDWKSFADNIAPNSVADSFIGSPLIQAFGSKNGKTWYGADIVPKRLQDDMASEQYDESTDLISIKLGELSRLIADKTKNDKFQLSPYKINYVLDQYGGFYGDIILPALTLSTDVGINNPVGKALASPILDKFTTDPVLKNQNVTTFYDLMDEMKSKSGSKYAKDEQKLSYKYLSSVATEMSKLYSQKRDIQGSRELTNKEKVYETRKIQQQINVYAKAGLANYDNIDIEGKYAAVGGVQYYQDSNGGWRKTRKETLEKMNNADLSMEDRSQYYETSEKISDIRDEIKKNTPEGQRADYAKDTIDAINNSKLSAKGKNTLYDSYYSSKATEHINSMNLTDEQKYDLKVAHQLAEGKKDENGKTISNSKAEATAEAYEKLGLLNDVLKYIKDNDIAPSEMGLSKTVYNKLIKSSSYQSAYNSSMKKKSSSKSKKSSSKKSNVSGGSSGIRKAGKLNKLGPVTSKSIINDKKIANGATNYMKAYASVFNRSGKKPNTGGRGASVTCPRCGSSVSSSNGKCPVCGANL